MGTVLFGFFFFDQQIFGEIRKDPFLFKPKMWKLCCILVAVSLTLLESKRVEAKPLEIQYNERVRMQSYGYPDGSYDSRSRSRRSNRYGIQHSSSGVPSGGKSKDK